MGSAHRRQRDRHLTHIHLQTPRTIFLTVVLLTFPVIVNAETRTFTVGTSADDGFISQSGATFPPTTPVAPDNSNAAVGPVNYFTGANYVVGKGLIRWDTSTLPDNATIQSAVFRCYVSSLNNDDNQSLTADWYSAWPIDIADWTATAQTSALAATPLSNFTAATTATISLSNAQGVSTTGYSGLRFHIAEGQPVLYNVFSCASFDDGVHTPPELIITYTLPSSSGGGTFSPGFLATLPRTIPPPEPPAPPVVIPGPIPSQETVRDLNAERAALTVFIPLFHRLPVSAADWLAVNHLAYGDRIERDLDAERSGMRLFTRRFGRLPHEGADWLIIHVLGMIDSTA